MAEFRLVLGVATGLAQLAQAVGKLALSPVAAAPTLREGPTQLSLVSGSMWGRQLSAWAGSQGCEAWGWGHPPTAPTLYQAGGAARRAGSDPGGTGV